MLVQLYLCTTQCNTLKERHAGVPRLPNAFCCQAFFHEVWGGGPPCGGQREPKISGIHTLHMHGWYVYIHRKCVKAEEIRRVEENDQKQRRPRRPLVHALSVCFLNFEMVWMLHEFKSCLELLSWSRQLDVGKWRVHMPSLFYWVDPSNLRSNFCARTYSLLGHKNCQVSPACFWQ